MAIFNKSNNQAKPEQHATTIIAKGSSFKGDISLENNLYIDGLVEGTVISKGNIIVGMHGCVRGDVFALKLTVQGLVEGAVDASRVTIKTKGKIMASVVAQDLVIESGGKFEGESRIKQSDDPPKLLEQQKKKSLFGSSRELEHVEEVDDSTSPL